MAGTVAIKISKPIKAVKTLTVGDAEQAESQLKSKSADEAMQDLERQKTAFSQLLLTLKSLVDKLNQFYDEAVASHKEEIAKLSVEIARKILVQKVQEGDYEIESIVKEALKNVPTHQDIVVHLNPEDLAGLQKAQQESPANSLAGIKFVEDPNIGRAECLIASGKGMVESLIAEQLEQIGKALEKAE